MAEPLADGGEVHPGLEKMDRRRMPQGMRVDALVGQGWHRLLSGRQMLAQEIANSEPQGHAVLPRRPEPTLPSVGTRNVR